MFYQAHVLESVSSVVGIAEVLELSYDVVPDD